MLTTESLGDVQRALADAGVDGWLLYDFRGLNPVAAALMRLDGDLYESTMDALTHLYDKLSAGGFVIIDDYHDLKPCRTAVDEFRARRSISAPLNQIDHAAVFWRKAAT